MLFDAATGTRRPGYATLSDQQLADRNAARNEMIDRATSAWRGPLSLRSEDARRKKRDDNEDDPDPDGDEDNGTDDRARDVRARSIAARDSYVAGLQIAWRRPAAASPTASHSPSPGRIHGLPTGSTRAPTRDAAEPDRDADYERRKAELSEAWKTSPKPPMARPNGRDPQALGMNWRGGA
jgi:hypothetical protein